MDKDTQSKPRKATNMRLIYDDKRDLMELTSKKQFINFILEDSLVAIEKAIKENLENVELFNIFNLSLIIELDRSNFKPVLEKIIYHYEGVEDYNKCAQIQSLINKI
jgi:hypothetical protein